ncbi:HAMP domain-containing sensor histidine kinase [Streptomyces sp. MI02-7b]|uniref:sensor histidine kinase n=1 Tax=Streptomyces sp. MI02-7b TaxID=462941 RepID=UPI0029AF17B4|nr:HAMP domain-containing sensor histidine kinase [Streptomyces sp. MI02-7b]MDX3075876.1 HAMP domain-containing sensor histidine kinase [Streptomyces sp. MI02-7b]
MTHRLLLSYLSLMALVLLALEVPFGFVYARSELNRFSHTAELGAVTLASVCEEKLEHGLASDLPQLARSHARRTGSSVVVADRRGIVLTDTTTATTVGRNISSEPDIAAALSDRPATGIRIVPGGKVLFATVPGASSDTVPCVVRTLYSLGPLAQKIHATWIVPALVGLGVLAVVALIGFALARWITRPLRALECATRQLADGRLTDPPATDCGPPELRQLATSFTCTANRLQHLLHAQEAFASEASHQLKTPLTSLRLRLENFEPHLAPCAQHSLEEAISEVGRLSRMVQGLLALARLENSAITPEVIDLDAVVADRGAIWTAFAGEQHVDITVAGTPAGPVWAVRGALEQIIDNLLSNALQASPPGSTITLVTAPAPTDYGRTPPMAELHVVDQGPGMTETERQRAFDRFWRATDAHHDGTGLGLSMVRRLTQAGGGDVTLDAAPHGGIDACIRLRPARATRIRRHPVGRAGPPHLARARAAGQEHGQARLLGDGAGHRGQTDTS